MNSKQTKWVKKSLGVGVEGDDRISALPDHLLCQILSYLTTKYAAKTSVLSKRWKYLFASVPIIDCVVFPRKRATTSGNFVAFMYRLLYLIGIRSSHIDRFCIRLLENHPIGRAIISSWISTAVSFNVHELSFSLRKDSSVLLHVPLFNCNSLTILKLEGKFLLTVPEHVSLPSLNSLSLTNAILHDDYSIKRLLSGCPVLEDLAFHSCNIKNINVFDISYPSIKRLAIHCRGNFELILSSPNLENLKITSYGAKRCSGDAFNSLVEVSINFKLEGREEVSKAKIHEIVNKACNAQKLFLCGDVMGGLTYAPNSLPIFHALTYLDLSSNGKHGWKSLLPLLESSPCLETLILRRLCNKDKQFPLPNVPICFSMYLKTIQLTYFRAQEEDFTLVEYILAEAKILENMKIYAIDPDNEHFQMTRERLLAFPTYSKTCKIFLGYSEASKAYQIL